MVNTRIIKSKMVIHNYTIKKLAEELNMSIKTLSHKLNTGKGFDVEIIEKLIRILKIDNPFEIFC